MSKQCAEPGFLLYNDFVSGGLSVSRLVLTQNENLSLKNQCFVAPSAHLAVRSCAFDPAPHRSRWGTSQAAVAAGRRSGYGVICQGTRPFPPHRKGGVSPHRCVFSSMTKRLTQSFRWKTSLVRIRRLRYVQLYGQLPGQQLGMGATLARDRPGRRLFGRGLVGHPLWLRYLGIGLPGVCFLELLTEHIALGNDSARRASDLQTPESTNKI